MIALLSPILASSDTPSQEGVDFIQTWLKRQEHITRNIIETTNLNPELPFSISVTFLGKSLTGKPKFSIQILRDNSPLYDFPLDFERSLADGLGFLVAQHKKARHFPQTCKGTMVSISHFHHESAHEKMARLASLKH